MEFVKSKLEGEGTGHDFFHGGFHRKPVPLRQHSAHAWYSPAPSFSRNSATRFPATAARYFPVDRISSIG